MPFHEVDYPLAPSYGTVSSSGFETDIAEAGSGNEVTTARREQMRHEFDIANTVRSWDDLMTLKEFHAARKGAANGWRFKDFHDFTSAANGRAAYASTDQTITTANGAQSQFQLIKTYASGAHSTVRTIRKPVSGEVSVSLDDTTLPATVDSVAYSATVNTTTGIVTITSDVGGNPPALGLVVKAGFEFAVPVRFDKAADLISLRLEDYDNGSASVPIIEILDKTAIPGEPWYGDSKEWDPLTGDISVSLLDGKVLVFNPDGAGHTVTLPAEGDVPAGGEHFIFINDSGSNTVAVEDDSAVSVGTLATNGSLHIVLARKADDSLKWYAI